MPHFAVAHGSVSGQAGIPTLSPTSIQWFHKLKLKMEEERLGRKGADGERKIVESTQIY